MRISSKVDHDVAIVTGRTVIDRECRNRIILRLADQLQHRRRRAGQRLQARYGDRDARFVDFDSVLF